MHKSMILSVLLERKTARRGLGELYQRDWEEKPAQSAPGSRGWLIPPADSRVVLGSKKLLSLGLERAS